MEELSAVSVKYVPGVTEDHFLSAVDDIPVDYFCFNPRFGKGMLFFVDDEMARLTITILNKTRADVFKTSSPKPEPFQVRASRFYGFAVKSSGLEAKSCRSVFLNGFPNEHAQDLKVFLNKTLGRVRYVKITPRSSFYQKDKIVYRIDFKNRNDQMEAIALLDKKDAFGSVVTATPFVLRHFSLRGATPVSPAAPAAPEIGVFISGLPLSWDKAKINELFEGFKVILVDLRHPKDKPHKLATVYLESEEEVLHAISQFNKRVFEGKPITVSRYVPKKESEAKKKDRGSSPSPKHPVPAASAAPDPQPILMSDPPVPPQQQSPWDLPNNHLIFANVNKSFSPEDLCSIFSQVCDVQEIYDVSDKNCATGTFVAVYSTSEDAKKVYESGRELFERRRIVALSVESFKSQVKNLEKTVFLISDQPNLSWEQVKVCFKQYSCISFYHFPPPSDSITVGVMIVPKENRTVLFDSSKDWTLEKERYVIVSVPTVEDLKHPLIYPCAEGPRPAPSSQQSTPTFLPVSFSQPPAPGPQPQFMPGYPAPPQQQFPQQPSLRVQPQFMPGYPGSAQPQTYVVAQQPGVYPGQYPPTGFSQPPQHTGGGMPFQQPFM